MTGHFKDRPEAEDGARRAYTAAGLLRYRDLDGDVVWMDASPPLPHRRASLPGHQTPARGDNLGTGATTTGFIAAVLDLGSTTEVVLPRKEVIQPQLPLRLPCYDFVPITRPTLDGCLPEGLAHRLQVLPAFVT
jgi:hypothetical protein